MQEKHASGRDVEADGRIAQKFVSRYGRTSFRGGRGLQKCHL